MRWSGCEAENENLRLRRVKAQKRLQDYMDVWASPMYGRAWLDTARESRSPPDSNGHSIMGCLFFISKQFHALIRLNRGRRTGDDGTDKKRPDGIAV